MNKILLVFIAFFIFTAILHAEDKTTTPPAKTQEKSLPRLRPFDAAQTDISFTKTVHGGVQHVLAKSADQTSLIQAIQAHLQKMTEHFKKGDFSVTEQQHGADMPGLARLKTAKPDEIKFEYRALEKGGQIHYASEYPQYVSALHEWFDAQAREHSAAELPGHQQHHSPNSE